MSSVDGLSFGYKPDLRQWHKQVQTKTYWFQEDGDTKKTKSRVEKVNNT